jgi:hypothetical protein
MIAKRVFLVLAAGALLLLQFADCMSAMTPDRASMKCCASMPCTPANHSHGCCKTMTSAQTPNMLPAASPSLHAPIIATVEYTRTLDIAPSAPVPAVTVEAPQHSPPELYTLHASLLI